MFAGLPQDSGLTTVSILLLVIWVAFLARTIINLLAVPWLRDGDAPTGEAPLVSVIIPARNEERSIEQTVRAFFAQTYLSLEIIAIDDRSTDATGVLLHGLAGEDARLTVIDNEEPPPGWLGKPWALHQGSLRARGSLLLFVDADVLYAPPAVAAAVAHLERRDVPMLALLPHFTMRGFWEHVIMPNLAFFAFSMIPLWLSNRTRIPLLALGGGTGNLIRRSDYDHAGGHEALKDAVVDDVGLARLVRRSGRRTEVVRADRMVSVRMYEGLRAIIEGFTKNGFAVAGRSYFLMVVFLLLGAIVHVLPYVLAFTGDGFAIGAVGALTLTRAILFRSLGYRLDNAVLGHPLMMAAWFVIMIRSTWITGVRRQLAWRGRTYDARRTRFGAD
jgi:glycosyltransferase involved in cell wall biosynthesis